jgi:hypothetical protein
VNADSIKALLAAPDTLMLSAANMEFTDSNGLNFDYVRQYTVAQTARVVIDFGGNDVRQYNVATNVDRNTDGSYHGIALLKSSDIAGRWPNVLEDDLELHANDPVLGYTTMVDSRGRVVIDSLLNHRYSAPSGVRTTWWEAVWGRGVESRPRFHGVAGRRLSAPDV